MPQTILLVDDSAVCREAVAACLRMSGYRVACAADGREARDLLDNCFPDLVLLDLAMPRMSGLDLLREIRQMPEGRDLPVILFTASGDVAATFHDLGVQDCLVKTQVSVATIRFTIARAVGRRPGQRGERATA